MNIDEQAKSVLDPILDVMSGADGGVAFAKLRHSFIPQILESACADQNAEDILRAFKVVARACEIMQGKIPTVQI